MNVPLKWLAEYVDLSAIPTADLVDRLTIAGLEVAGVRLLGEPVPPGLKAKQLEPGPAWDRDKIFVAHILKIEKHPNADALKLVTLDYGAGVPKQVVTGAPNIAVGESGQRVILGLNGSTYWMGDKKDAAKGKALVTLKPKELRGIMNDAMCMSDFELGISEEHDGIIILDGDAPIGTPAVDYIGDTILEIDVLPNMARCLSMIGVAREVAAVFGCALTAPRSTATTAGESVVGKVGVEIADMGLCPRYSARLIRNVTIQPSPGWMRRRLHYAGMRPINNVVDVTNYVMLEWGQPLHAFDYDVLVARAGGQPPTITVRPARPGERLKTLDGQDRELTPDQLLIADSAGPIALAGVMGGLETEVTDKSVNVLLESAAFDAVSIRKTAHRFTLFSEASTRFSRGVHPDIVPQAGDRAAELIARCSGGTVLAGAVDNYPNPKPVQIVPLPRREIRRLLGTEIADADVVRILSALHFQVVPTADGWNVTVPGNRLDIQSGSADLIEELVRINGYDRLPATLLSGELPPQRNNRDAVLETTVRDAMSAAGNAECRCYSLTAADRETRLGITGPSVELVNPISPERSAMRRSLLPGLLDVAAENLKHAAGVRLFELGFVYIPKDGERLPQEPRRLAIVLSGRRFPSAWDDPQGASPAPLDFYDLKGVVERLVHSLHVTGLSYRSVSDVAYLHPARSAALMLNDRTIGSFGELHPRCGSAFGLADRIVLAGEFDLEALFAVAPERFPYTPVRRTPPALRDVAVVVDANIPNDRVMAEIRAAGGELLSAISLFDVYVGESISAGKKSLAYALTYQSDKTLVDKEIDKAHKKIEDRLKHVLKATIRGKE